MCNLCDQKTVTSIDQAFVHVLGMLRIGERRLVMLTMLQMEGKLAKGDDPSLNAKVSNSSPLQMVNSHSV